MHGVKAVFVCAIITPLHPKITYKQAGSDCALDYPPRTRHSVDKFASPRCATQALVRTYLRRAEKPPRKSRPSGKQWNGDGTAGYLIGLDQKRKRKE
jgi:hypothetical protein